MFSMSRMYWPPGFHMDTDEGGGASGSSDEEEEEESEEEEPEVEEAAEEEEEPEDKGKKKDHAPPEGSKRFKKIYAGHKLSQKYMTLGTPEEIARGQARLEELETKAVAKAEDEPVDKELKAKRAAIRKQMREYEPNLEKLEGQLAYHAEVQESLKIRSADAVIEVMEEHGFEVDEENFNAMAGAVQSVMAREKKLYLIWLTNPEKAVKIAYTQFAETFQQEGTRKKNAALLKGKKGLKGLPKTVKGTHGGPGGTVKPGKEAQTIKEAEDMFKAGWQQATQ